METRPLRREIEFQATVRGIALRFQSTWGLFSPREIDAGSRLLIENVDVRPDDVCLDLGCGYGAIGVPLAKTASGGSVTMVDKDFVAVDYARRNARLNGCANAASVLSNGFSALADRRFSLVVSNLPANVGKEMLTILLEDARTHLEPGGRLVVVTIAGLREFVRRSFLESFGNYEKVKQGRAHTVALAVR
ncbi:methyltransferase [Candidatus Poribacteria bacterium]|nr:methyltransferase [Candidatus Poribacteria bacterium]